MSDEWSIEDMQRSINRMHEMYEDIFGVPLTPEQRDIMDRCFRVDDDGNVVWVPIKYRHLRKS